MLKLYKVQYVARFEYKVLEGNFYWRVSVFRDARRLPFGFKLQILVSLRVFGMESTVFAHSGIAEYWA